MLATMPSPAASPWRGWRCGICGERIGVYEPLVHVTGEGPVRTSLAAEPALAELPDTDAACLFHADCHARVLTRA